MTAYFDHEKLHVYLIAIEFIVWADELIEHTKRHIAVLDHLDRASTSIVLNIAEGNGKSSTKDRSRYMEIARGSAVECAACLDILVAKKVASQDAVIPGKEKLRSIVNMLCRLIQSITDRVQEEPGEYSISCDGD